MRKTKQAIQIREHGENKDEEKENEKQSEKQDTRNKRKTGKTRER